jgi:hypothetical protein
MKAVGLRVVTAFRQLQEAQETEINSMRPRSDPIPTDRAISSLFSENFPPFGDQFDPRCPSVTQEEITVPRRELLSVNPLRCLSVREVAGYPSTMYHAIPIDSLGQ